jgi:hypothetical protein
VSAYRHNKIRVEESIGDVILIATPRSGRLRVSIITRKLKAYAITHRRTDIEHRHLSGALVENHDR